MKLFSEGKAYRLYEGSMLDMLDVIEPESIDSIVTDPPYELNFMNKSWDNSGIAFQKSTWEKCYQVLKPGGYLLCFGGSRTHHRVACAIEDAGFEIRDCIMWIFGSGFPKSMNIGLAIDKKNGIESPVVGQNKYAGWGTQLKPAYEAIIVARKPFEGSCVDNVIKYGVGGINIDECRVPISPDDIELLNAKSSKHPTDSYNYNESKKYGDYALNIATPANTQGRFPANLILTYDETDKEEVCGGFPESKGASSQNNFSNGHIYRGQSLSESNTSLDGYREWYNDDGSAARYFYCAKANKRDRNDGVTEKTNNHPTVKPCDLMQYLVRLVTPKDGVVLDPFNGSGSTGKAVAYENYDRHAGYKYVGIELSSEYLKISDSRISYVEKLSRPYKLV